MVNGVVDGAVVEVDRRESESKGCDVFYPFGLAPPTVALFKTVWSYDVSILIGWLKSPPLVC
jgi:hypothetical protein